LKQARAADIGSGKILVLMPRARIQNLAGNMPSQQNDWQFLLYSSVQSHLREPQRLPRPQNAAARGKQSFPGTGQVASMRVYLRAAQAYMLISMPTGTSTIFGVFQAIRASLVHWRGSPRMGDGKTVSSIAQA
jgi:hypothetical protein